MLALWAARGSAPLRGGRWRGHPLTACAHSGIPMPGRDEERGFAGPNKGRLPSQGAVW